MTDFPPTANPASPPTAKALALEDWLVVLIMAALALITFANVLLRYFTDTSFAWTEEISIFLMIVLAMVGGSSAVARDQHIRIEFFSGNGTIQRASRAVYQERRGHIRHQSPHLLLKSRFEDADAG
mgnify:CR=1 FL=1